MNIHFLFPAWFLLLIPAVFALYHWRSVDPLRNVLRIILTLLLITALAQPRIKLEKPGGVLVVVADRSQSMPEGFKEKQRELIQDLLEKERGDRDLIGVVGFAEDVYLEQLPDLGKFAGFRGYYAGNSSRLATALENAVSLIPKDRHGRILLLSDGRFSGLSPLDVEALSRRKGIPVDFRIMQRPLGRDPAILSLDPPAKVEPGEAFQFSAELFLPEKT